MAPLMHAKELARRPTVVGRGVDAHNVGLCDSGAGGGVAGQVHRARAAEEAGVVGVEQERPHEEAAAAHDVCSDYEMTLRARKRDAAQGRVRALPGRKFRRKLSCRTSRSLDQLGRQRHSQRILRQSRADTCQTNVKSTNTQHCSNLYERG